MDWNKEEAIRAKGIAQGKMENMDFVGARRIALKAQRLCAELENIPQILIVCEVHCVADQKLFGSEPDWYGILNVEPTADEATIKKQYKKLALQLHPDKNKFPGAEAAFKLIGEAKKVLLDKGKRSLHDIKRKPLAPRAVPPHQSQQGATHFSKSRVPNNVRANDAGVNPQQPATNQGFPNGRPTFWTICPFCSVKYLYFIEAMNKSLPCKTCCKTFVAFPTDVQGVPTATNLNQTAFPSRNDASYHGSCEVDGDHNAKHSRTEFSQTKGFQPGKVSQRVNSKRRRNQQEEPNKRCNGRDSKEETPIDVDGDFCAEANVECHVKRPRRSAQRQSVEAEIDLSQSSSSTPVSEPELVECPDPEFNDFDSVRHGSCFSAGQMWAIYDTIDAMPRFYARINKVFSPGFKVQITWLEPDPDDEDQQEWVDEDLPVACGKFRLGKSETTEDRLMFSHLVQWEKGIRRNTYKIYPRKAETWALFKNWDKMKKSAADKKYEYEFVEVLSEYDEAIGARVAPLVKVDGFTSLFRQASEKGKRIFQVPPEELFRFANRVPSFKMTGEERVGVPKGCFELDPACSF